MVIFSNLLSFFAGRGNPIVLPKTVLKVDGGCFGNVGLFPWIPSQDNFAILGVLILKNSKGQVSAQDRHSGSSYVFLTTKNRGTFQME